nr:reverse transcriptase domain-containing protein [Tanacetum cinerariifolium]
MLFPFSLEGAARIWLEKEPSRSIFTWDDLVSKFINQFFPPSKTTNLHNEITNFQQHFDEYFSKAWDRFKDLLIACPHHGFLELHQLDTFYNALNSKDQDSLNSAAGGSFLDKTPRECLAIIEIKSKVRYSCNKLVVAKVSMNTSTSGISPDGVELKDMVKALLLDKKSQNQAPTTVKAVEDSCVTCGGAYFYRNFLATDGNVYRINIQEFVSQAFAVNYNQRNTSYHPPMIVVSYDGPQIPPPPSFLPKVVENEPKVTKDTVHPTNNGSTEDVQPLVFQSKSPILTSEPVNFPVIALRPNLRPSIPYPSRLQDQKLCDKANDQREKFFQIFKDLNFNIIFSDDLILIPKFGPSIKSLLTNKDKLCEVARTLLNEHCSAVLPKKLPEKLGDPDKFLIPCDFPRKAECLALVDLDVNINLMPLSVWNKLSLPDLSPTCMNLELADRLISRLIGVAEDVYVKVGELTLRVGKEAITFNLDQSSRYSANYNEMTSKQIDVIDMACEEYSQEVLEVDAFLAIEDDPTSPKVNQSYLNPEGDILLLESFLNDDPSLPPPNQGNYLPKVRKELKICEAKSDKSSNDEPLEVELKDLPPHLEYVFLEGNDKLPVIIAKDLSVEEKTALITVLKSHNRAIGWKLSDIKVVKNEDNELIPTHLVTGWRVCIDYHQEKTTFTCPYGTFAYRRMPFGLCNALGTFQSYLFHLERMLKMYEDTNLCLNWEKIHFMVKYGIVLGYKISKEGIKVVKAKVDVVTKLPHPIIVKECVEAFQTLKRKLTKAPILIAPDWDIPFELMCDASDFAIGAVLWQRQDKHFRPIHYASKTTTEAESNYTTTEKEMIAVVEKTKRFHDSKIKDRVFNISDRILLFYSRLNIFSGKLKSCWSGPFTISHVYPYGTVELSQPDKPDFKVNGHRLKHYFREDVPKMVVPDLQTFLKDY